MLAKNKIQCATVLKKDVVDKIDNMAKQEARTRSNQIAFIIEQYFRKENND
jgi:metal-responsive CopG/Arc/MetJ family transcriptional regulator